MKNKTVYFSLIILFISSLFYEVTFGQPMNDSLNVLPENKTESRYHVNSSRPLLVSGLTQVRYQNLEESGKNDGFDLRKARLDMKGTINPFWGYRFVAEFAGSPKLLDAYADYKINNFINFTIGQFKIPFSLENLYSDSKLEFIDRSQVVEALVARSKDVIGNQNGRDIGVQVNGKVIKISNRYMIDYTLGIFNGSGINASDNNENKEIIGRIILHPFKGLDIGGSILSGKGFYGEPTMDDHLRNRIGVELNYEYSRFNLKGEYIQGLDGIIHRNGWYLQTGYFILPSKFQLLAKYDTYDPDSKISDNISSIYFIGMNYYINIWVKLMTSYGFRTEEGFSVNNNIGAIQLQLTF